MRTMSNYTTMKTRDAEKTMALIITAVACGCCMAAGINYFWQAVAWIVK